MIIMNKIYKIEAGYSVSMNRKKLWDIEISILKDIGVVCEENNLDYFLHAGAGIGAILGGGMYALNCWISGEEFSWAEFGVSVLAGAASGATAAALLPVNPILAGTVAGAVGGAIMEGGITHIRTGDFKAS